MVIGVGLAAAAGMGAVGGIVANIALTPLTAGAGLLQSYWYGSGLILGERMMYTVHWEKVKARLDKGENFMDILDQEMNDDITAVAMLAFKAMDKTAEIFHSQASISLGKFIEELISAALNPFFSGTRTPSEEESENTTGEHEPISASEVTNWTITQLTTAMSKIADHPHKHYTAVAEANITQEFFKRKETAVEPPPTNLIDDQTPTSSIAPQMTASNAPNVHTLIREGVNNKIIARTYEAAYLQLGQQLASMVTRIERWSGDIAAISAKKEIEDFIIALNKWLAI